VARRLAVVAGQVGRVKVQPLALLIEQGTRLRAGLAVHQAEPEAGDVR
jgi:hypothetical protein